MEGSAPASAGEGPPLPPRPDGPTRNTDSLWAIVLGALSVALFFPFGPVIGAFAIWFGRKGYRRAIAGARGRGLAVAGLVLGVIGLAAGAVTWVAASACDCL